MDRQTDLIDFGQLLAREQELRDSGATLRMRDAARELGVPEGALVEARRETQNALRLRPGDRPEGFGALLRELHAAGEVMALTRNENCVHEKHGRYNEPEFFGAMGQIVGEIDLRVFMQHWIFGYALTENVKSGLRRSLQFFDASGEAVHKIYATDNTDKEAFERIVTAFADPDAPSPVYQSPPAVPEPKPDDEIDKAKLLSEWQNLEHSHDFHGLLKRHGITRDQALRVGTPPFVRPLPPDSMQTALQGVAERQIPVMIFVGNRGCIQIHSGPVHRIELMGPWLNVLDPRFNLHLRKDRIASARLVRMPSKRGDVHQIECFDDGGQSFCQLFGERKPGHSERTDWREFVNSLAVHDTREAS